VDPQSSAASANDPRAGFYVVGIDKYPQPNYCGDAFIQGDALELMARLWDGGILAGFALDEIAGHHASAPCQARSDLSKQSKLEYPELVPPTRRWLRRFGQPYVMENVEGATVDPEAQLIDPITLCGTMFPGLRVIRHRLFESNFPLEAPPHPDKHPLVFTYDKRKAHYGRLDQNTSFVQDHINTERLEQAA
jgi:DNA (cytosine-5)-methyltransferase 1